MSDKPGEDTILKRGWAFSFYLLEGLPNGRPQISVAGEKPTGQMWLDCELWRQFVPSWLPPGSWGLSSPGCGLPGLVNRSQTLPAQERLLPLTSF